jgi:hypothetical protein
VAALGGGSVALNWILRLQRGAQTATRPFKSADGECIVDIFVVG